MKIPWTEEEEEMVLRHDIPDSQLSMIIGHSVAAIQIRRSRLKRGLVGQHGQDKGNGEE